MRLLCFRVATEWHYQLVLGQFRVTMNHGRHTTHCRTRRYRRHGGAKSFVVFGGQKNGSTMQQCRTQRVQPAQAAHTRALAALDMCLRLQMSSAAEQSERTPLVTGHPS